MSESTRGFWGAMAHGLEGIGERMRPSVPRDPELAVEAFLLAAESALAAPARSRAAGREAVALAKALRQAPPEMLAALLGAMSVGLGLDRSRLRAAVEGIDWDDTDSAGVEALLAAQIGAKRRELCRRWLALRGSLEFMAWLRERVAEQGRDPAIEPLRLDLDAMVGELFSHGLLKAEQITWRSPALLLEKVMSSARGSHRRDWGDVKSRLGRDRRLFALFHSGWADEPLAFMEVRLGKGLAKSVAEVAEACDVEPGRADTATFYAISVPRAGLKGLAFGDLLIREAAASLRAELPRVRTFQALSPIPGLAAWARARPDAELARLAGDDGWERLGRKAGSSMEGGLAALLALPGWELSPWAPAAKEPLERLAAAYLGQSESGGEKVDPVARFHLRGGSRLAGSHHLADPSESGLRDSFGLMASYLYDEAALAPESL